MALSISIPEHLVSFGSVNDIGKLADKAARSFMRFIGQNPKFHHRTEFEFKPVQRKNLYVCKVGYFFPTGKIKLTLVVDTDNPKDRWHLSNIAYSGIIRCQGMVGITNSVRFDYQDGRWI